MLYSFGHEPLVVTSAKDNVGTPQLSVAVGVVHDGVPEHSMMDGPGNPEITGGVVSSTLIVCDAVAVFPQPSSAVQVRVILKSPGHAPFVVTSAKLKEGTPQLSVAVGTSKEGVPPHSIVVTPGNPEITGGTVSSTLMVCVAVAVLPQPSSAVQVRVILYSEVQVPLVVLSAKVKTGVPQLSVAVGVVHEGVPEHSIIEGPGNPEITGGIVSSILIIWEAVAVFPQSSVAVQVLVMLYSFGHVPFVVTSAKLNTGTPQLSVAVGVVQDGVPEHSIAEGPGSPEITGGMVSSTLIVCVAVAVFPHPSSAVQVRVILYSFGQVPFVVTSAKLKVGTPQLSVTVGVVQDGVPEHSIVVGPGNPETTGGVASSTLKTWVAVAVFPHPSSAVQVRVTVYSFGQDPFVVTSAKVNVGTPQISVAVGVVHEGVSEHSMAEGPGNPEMTGGIVSSTLMTCDAVAVLPHPSSAVQVRVIVYSFGQAPLVVTSAKVNVGSAQLSVAVGVAQEGMPEHSIDEGPGNPEITGGIVSSTLMVCDAEAELPQSSVAVHVLVMLYSLGHVPLVVTSANVNTGTPQLSVAVGMVHDGVPEHSIVVTPGKPEITGGMVSSTLIVCDAVAVFPQSSVAVHVRVML